MAKFLKISFQNFQHVEQNLVKSEQILPKIPKIRNFGKNNIVSAGSEILENSVRSF